MCRQPCVRPPSDTHSSTLCRQLLRGLRQGSPLTISSSRAVRSATNDTRSPRLRPVVGKAVAWGCPPSSIDHQGLPAEEGEHHSSGTPPSLFGFSLSSLSIPSIVWLAFWEDDSIGRSQSHELDKTHSQPQPTETWELVPLSIVCNPYYKLSASNTGCSSQLDVGTFRSNQCISSCSLCTAIQTQTRNPLNLLVGGF
jgi:hypothetical protein